MARRKKANTKSVNNTVKVEDLTGVISDAFDQLISNKFGHLRAPEPIVTPTGIRHLDALLGGGIYSSNPIILSSTPETGKSTFAFQFSHIFQSLYPNSVTLYLDVEGAANTNDSIYQSRMEIFGLSNSRFKYQPLKVRVSQAFSVFDSVIELKRRIQEETNNKINLLIIWDSLAATAALKVDEVQDPNKIIGLKAREIGFFLEKLTPALAFEQVTFIMIDQVRANLKVDGNKQYQASEKSVGEFKDFKAATSILSLNHRTGQWLFLSKKSNITPAESLGINGWYLDIYTEKNKFAPSQLAVRVVFDKLKGIDKFWSEYTFLSELTPSEAKFYRNKKYNVVFPIKSNGAFVNFEYTDPNTGEVLYTSKNFYRKDAKTKYYTDEEFRHYFDKAIEDHINERIYKGLFMIEPFEKVESSKTTIEEDDSDSVVLSEPDIDAIKKSEPLYEPVFSTESNNMESLEG